jgi:Zn-dependent M16 (insulinase) family peptidase
MANPLEKYGFKEIQSFRTDWVDAEARQYESLRTGLQIVMIERQSAMVIGEFIVSTLPEDDSGLPHTLEHMIFFVCHFI